MRVPFYYALIYEKKFAYIYGRKAGDFHFKMETTALVIGRQAVAKVLACFLLDR